MRIQDMEVEASERCDVCGKATRMRITTGNSVKEVECICDCFEQKEAVDDSKLRRALGDGYKTTGTFDADDGENEELSDLCRAYVETFDKSLHETGNGLLLFGESDKGKTFAAECIANTLIKDGYVIRMRSVPRLATEYQDDSFNASSMTSPLEACDLLILDDWGAERGSEFIQEMLYGVVDARYRAGLPLIVTTNFTREELFEPMEQLRSRMRSRILEMCLPFEVKGTRKRATAKRYDDMRRAIYGR